MPDRHSATELHRSTNDTTGANIAANRVAKTDGSGGFTYDYWHGANGGGDLTVALGNLGTTETINLASGNDQTGTLNANCTIGFTGFPSGRLGRVELWLTEDGTGGWTPTFTSVTWVGDTPTHDTTAGTTTGYLFWSRDGGSTVFGIQIGGGSSTITIEDEGTPLATAATTLDFVGAGVSASGTGAEKTITIPGGGHVHIVSEPFVGDASATVFYLANEAELDTVAAYNPAGARVAITQDTTELDKVTFAAAPASGTGWFDYVAATD